MVEGQAAAQRAAKSLRWSDFRSERLETYGRRAGRGAGESRAGNFARWTSLSDERAERCEA